MNIENITFDGKKVGLILNETIYVSPRKQSKHLYRGGVKTIATAKRDGTASWGVSNGLLAILKARGVKLIVIHDSETANAYYANIGRFEKDSTFLDFGGDLQKFLLLPSWSVAEYDKFIETIGKFKKGVAA